MIEKFSESSALEKNRELFSDLELDKIWAKVLIYYPQLKRVQIIIPSVDESLRYTGAEFLLPDDENPEPAIVILPADNSVYERLKEDRPLAIKIAADLLGKPFSEMSSEDIKQFIFIHEVGHTYDFIVNFDTVLDWNMSSIKQMNSLPVPGLDPNDLRIAIGGGKELSELTSKRPELLMNIKKLNIATINDLLEAQELAYRNLPKEFFADQFAARFFTFYKAFHV